MRVSGGPPHLLLRPHKLLIRPVVVQGPPLGFATLCGPKHHSFSVRLLEQPHGLLTIAQCSGDGRAPPGVHASQVRKIELREPPFDFQRLVVAAEVHQHDPAVASEDVIVRRDLEQSREQRVRVIPALGPEERLSPSEAVRVRRPCREPGERPIDLTP